MPYSGQMAEVALLTKLHVYAPNINGEITLELNIEVAEVITLAYLINNKTLISGK